MLELGANVCSEPQIVLSGDSGIAGRHVHGQLEHLAHYMIDTLAASIMGGCQWTSRAPRSAGQVPGTIHTPPYLAQPRYGDDM